MSNINAKNYEYIYMIIVVKCNYIRKIEKIENIQM